MEMTAKMIGLQKRLKVLESRLSEHEEKSPLSAHGDDMSESDVDEVFVFAATMTREQAVEVFALERERIVQQCCQLLTDVNSFNANANVNEGDPILIVFDFRRDVMELRG